MNASQDAGRVFRGAANPSHHPRVQLVAAITDHHLARDWTARNHVPRSRESPSDDAVSNNDTALVRITVSRRLTVSTEKKLSLRLLLKLVLVLTVERHEVPLSFWRGKRVERKK